MKLHFIAIILFILGGCGSKYVVTFDSNPQGASLVCGEKNWGYTPMKLYFDESVKKQSSINVSNCSANWVSGAKKYYPSNLKVYPEGGTIITLDRPSGDGYAQDAEFALQIRQTEAMERVAAATERAATAATRSADEAQRRNNKIITCYTNFGVTTCY